ncbi:uncharacterized protein LOC111168510 isoform X1 [Delphinapterus leucas]|uniref:Uncharacterized protein LOC111168510 isoform X1 n=1 Tax=Delphinapterus leucas TaxID=9749 RepID=A0A2Y9M733_DELLE|nr:uncharacterized protein LOC111168510 isoform X1 [Delphinapterus leucas]
MMTLKVSWFPNHPVGENGAKLESLSQPGPSATGLAQESRRVRRQPLCAPVPTVLGRFLLFSAGITPSTSGSGTLLLKDFPWAAAQTSLLLLLGLLLAALGFIWKLRQEKERERWTKEKFQRKLRKFCASLSCVYDLRPSHVPFISRGFFVLLQAGEKPRKWMIGEQLGPILASGCLILMASGPGLHKRRS